MRFTHDFDSLLLWSSLPPRTSSPLTSALCCFPVYPSPNGIREVIRDRRVANSRELLYPRGYPRPFYQHSRLASFGNVLVLCACAPPPSLAIATSSQLLAEPLYRASRLRTELVFPSPSRDPSLQPLPFLYRYLSRFPKTHRDPTNATRGSFAEQLSATSRQPSTNALKLLSRPLTRVCWLGVCVDCFFF